MLRNRIYYGLKPLIPRTIRMAVRRSIATRAANACDGCLADHAGLRAAHRKTGQAGPMARNSLSSSHTMWKAAVGLERCRDLMQLDMDLGFRSSFNFVPEGELPGSSPAARGTDCKMALRLGSMTFDTTDGSYQSDQGVQAERR